MFLYLRSAGGGPDAGRADADLCMYLCVCTSGQLAVDLTQDEQMRQVLGVMPVRRLQRTAVRCEGPLVRRHRFTGWKPVWVREGCGMTHLAPAQHPLDTQSDHSTEICLISSPYLHITATSGALSGSALGKSVIAPAAVNQA